MSVAELVVVRGRDARAYLQSQLTADLAGLGALASVPTLVLDPKGDLVAAGAVHLRAEEDLALEVATGLGGAVVARLSRFVLRSQLELTGPVAPEGPPWPWFADELARVEAGVPGPRELARGLVPHALEPELLEAAVSFTKGCYPGQELVARMRARGAQPPYVLRRATLAGPVEPGDAAGDERFEGVVTSVAARDDGTRRALVVVHRRDAAEGALVVRTATGEVPARLD